MKLLAVLAALSLFGCDPCDPGETRERVHEGRGFVCIPEQQQTTNVTVVSSASNGAPTTTTSCTATPVTSLAIDLVAARGAPPAVMPGAPPDGTYTLVRATSYGDVERPPVSLRANVVKSGPRLAVGAQATRSGQADAAESFLVTLAGPELVKVCATTNGTVAAMLFPGDTGSAQAVTTGWDPASLQLTLVLPQLAETFVLVFALT